MTKKVYIETLGCQMNKSDSEKILGILETQGYKETTLKEEADLLVMNTCSIRAASENKAFSHLGIWKKLKKANPDIKIAVCGCIAQQTKEKIFKRAPQVDLIFGTHNIEELPELIKQLASKEKVCSILKTPYESEEKFYSRRQEGLSAWLPIIEGCDYFCTYCVVPYTRGRQRSRLPEDIISEAKEIISQGYKEITLLGQTVDSYGKDFGKPEITLSSLLRELNGLDGLMRIRFVTSHPADITDELIKTVAKLDKVCEYFHLPMQSGSTEVLAKMKRPYTRDEYLTLVNKIKKEIPDVAITSDFIAGFPGETEEQFNETLSIIDEVGFDQCNVAAYSPRKQTPAAVWKDQISYEEKKRRHLVLFEKTKEATVKANEKYVGRVLQVLPDNYKEQSDEIILTGRTRNNKLTHFKGSKDLIGRHVDVEITEASIWCLKGRIKL
ncbi:MAG TPA: tRNA (N6-isopentenyl adenosine(37)-C2)-methylthiotransferase MiaB [Cyanobacteria bacterium UBA9971]|nr:tRNA (N6-isopentenyl adenosine(37)-C2)-methylthiotransferase MiaB [Cyanobacteria bacterium UBA9971]